jgi:hypothetical protein
VSLTAVPAVTLAAALLAAPAGASVKAGTTGSNMYSPMQAGYSATQNSFRFVKADFTLPDPTAFQKYVDRVEYTVEFWSSSRDTVLGVYASTSDSSATPWHIEAKVYNNSTHALMCATWSTTHKCNGIAAGAHWSDTYPVGDVMELSSYFSKSNGTDRFHAQDLNSKSNSYDYYKTTTNTFGQARISTEFGCTPWTPCGSSLNYTAPPSSVPVMQADDCELSVSANTLIGFAGPFTHSKVIMTSNGKSTGTVLAMPENLGQHLNGKTSDFPDGEFDVALP